MFQQIIPDAMVQAGGWAILHSLWQGAIITLLLAFILGRTRQQSPALRYHLSVGALFLLLGAVIGTFMLYYEPGPDTGYIFGGTGDLPLAYFMAENPAAQLAQTDDLQRIFPFLLQVWLVGVALMGIRMLGEMAYLQRLRSVNTQSVAAPWMERLNALKWQLGVTHPVALRESMRVSSPMLVGWIKPVILLPVGLLSGLSVRQVECVLAHELAHIARMDYVVNLIQSAVEVFLFFNPAVWWISAQIREEREHCCDELAVELTGDRLTLVKTLAQLEEWRMQSGQLGLAFNGRPQGILGRVQRLLGGESSVRIIGKGLWSLLFFSMATGLLAFQSLREATAADYSLPDEGLRAELAAVAEVRAILEDEGVYAQQLSPGVAARHIAAIEAELARAADKGVMEKRAQPLRSVLSGLLERLPYLKPDPVFSGRDTIPVEKWQKEMQALQEQMHKLQEEMMNSAEMQQVRELTKRYETEMRAAEEKLKSEHGNYEKLMEEQRQVMQQIERKHRELMESSEFKAMHEEQEKIGQEFARQADQLRKLYEGKPYLLEYKLDSLSETLDDRHEAFEKQYEEVVRAVEKEMEAFEESPQMQELHNKMDAINEQYEKMLSEQMEPMEEQMERLQEVLENKYQEQLQKLEEQLEKLHQQRYKREE